MITKSPIYYSDVLECSCGTRWEVRADVFDDRFKWAQFVNKANFLTHRIYYCEQLTFRIGGHHGR